MNNLIDLEKLKEIGDLKFQENKAEESCCPDIKFSVVSEEVSNSYIRSISYTRYVIMMFWD